MHAMLASDPLQRFAYLQERVECPFARGARHAAAPPWIHELGWTANLDRVADAFAHAADALLHPSRRAVSRAGRDQLDGFVIEVREPGAGDSLASLARTTRRLLLGLAERDRPRAPEPLGDVESRAFWFRFANVRCFVAVFAACYPPSSSRFAHGLPDPLFVFQAEAAFTRLFGHGRSLAASRPGVRRAFAAAGRPYDASLSESPYEAYRYVKPLHLGEPVVRWWRDPDAPDAPLPAAAGAADDPTYVRGEAGHALEY
jgi:hypothetical protein